MGRDIEPPRNVNCRLRILLVLAAVMLATLLVFGVLLLVTKRTADDLW